GVELLTAGMSVRVRADHSRPVDPRAGPYLGARADQRRSVDAGAGVDLRIGVNPQRLACTFAWELDLDLAFQAVEVGFGVRGVTAHILPVPVGDPAEYTLSFLQELRENITGPGGGLAGPEEIEDGGVEDVDARVGEVRDHLAPARLLDEPLHRATLVDDHDAVLERVGNGLENDGRDGLALAVESGCGAKVDVGERVARDDDECFVQLLSRDHPRPRRAER